MGDNEDYTFSSKAKRKPKKLRIKKTYMNDDDDAVGTSAEPRSSTPPPEPAASVSPSIPASPPTPVSPPTVNVPSHQTSPRSIQDSPQTQRGRLALKSRLKRYQKDGDEVIPAATISNTSGDTSINSSSARSTGDGPLGVSSSTDSDEMEPNRAAGSLAAGSLAAGSFTYTNPQDVSSSTDSDEVVPNRAAGSLAAGSFAYTNPQEDSRSRNVHKGKSEASSLQECDASLQIIMMEDDENEIDSDSDYSDSETYEMENADYEEDELEEDGTLSKVSTQRYEKYRSVLGRSSSNEDTWEKPTSKLGAPPSFDYDPSQPRQKASMFGGTSDVESSAYKLPPGTLDGTKPPRSPRGNSTDSPVPESKILDKEDMKTLKMMLLDDSDNDSDTDGGVYFPSMDDKTVETTAEVLNKEDSNQVQVQGAMSEDVDIADDVCEEVSYHSSEIPMSGHGSSKAVTEMLACEEGDELSEIGEDDSPNHRAMMGMAAIAGAAAAKGSSQREVEEVTEFIASEREEPSKSTYEQSESMTPLSERIEPATKTESEERKSEASAIAAAVAASGYKSNLVQREVEKPAPKEEPKVERMVELKAVPKPDSKSLKGDKDLGGFLDAEAAKDHLARKRMSQNDRDQHSERPDNISTSQGDDDDFSDLWEQSVVEENKGRPFSDRSTGKDTDASSRTSAKGAGKETDSQADEKNGEKEAAAGAAAGFALASTTRPPADTPQDESDSSMDFDFGNGNGNGNGPLQTGDDDNSMDSFSLGASKDIESLATSKFDKEEYKPKRSGSEGSLSLAGMEAMNTGMKDFEGLSDSDLGKKMEADPVDKPNKTSSKETKSSAATALRKPTFSAGARRNCVRGTMLLLLLAAVAVPIYFLITGQEARADKDIQSVELFGPLPTTSPSQNSVMDTMQPQPTIAAVSPTIQPVAPTPSPTAVTPRPTTQSPSMQPVTPTRSPSQSPSLRPSTLSPSQLPTMNPVEFLDEFLTANSPDLQVAFTDTSSAQYRSLLWLSTDPNLFSYPNFKIIQRFALATFYLSTGGNTWANDDAWLTDVDECLWYSSRTNIAPCDSMGLFVNLELELNNIGGALPSELSLLSNSLTRIDLTRTGSPDFLSGPIPSDFGQLTKLEYFVLRGNQITGSLPPTLGRWTLLEVADLSNNLLSGPIPQAAGMLSQLSILDLDGNQLNGPIPTTIGRLTKIRNLSVANNRLTGPIPSEIGRLFLLEDLNLEQNELTTLPAELGNLILLRFLSLSKNNITGLLPPQIGSLINVLTLDLSENALSGVIPTEMGNLFLIRDSLNLSFNQFSGPIPNQLGRLIFLKNLEVQSNRLTGPVPASFAALGRINSLRLDKNDLTGTVPDAVCDVYASTFPTFASDCVTEIVCPCCLYCCEDAVGCECQFAGTDFDFLCGQFVLER